MSTRARPVILLVVGLLLALPQTASMLLLWFFAPRLSSVVAAVVAAALFVVFAALVTSRAKVLAGFQRVLLRQADFMFIGGIEFSLFGLGVGALLQALLAGVMAHWMARTGVFLDAL